jgi:hypothetical protein
MDMRVPQVSERIKEAPAQALRGVFAGIGQLLLITDKLRNKASHQEVPRARRPEASETVTDAAVTSPADQDAETSAAPAGVPTAEPPTAEAAPAEPPTAEAAPAEAATDGGTVAAEPAPAKATTARPAKRRSTRNFDKTGNVRLLGDEADSAAVSAAPEPAAAAEQAAAPEPAAAAPEPVIVAEQAAAVTAAPLPNYDELSVASLRARLRNLDVAQVRQLAEYERTHAARADVLTMFERRITKLEAEA